MTACIACGKYPFSAKSVFGLCRKCVKLASNKLDKVCGGVGEKRGDFTFDAKTS